MDTQTPTQSDARAVSAGVGARSRRTDLDVLRIAICASVILAHALLIFAAEPRYHLKSAEPSFIASVLYEFMRATTMAFFFVLAGWSALASLRGRTPERFVLERIIRLLAPLAAGIVLFGSVIKYIELSHGRDMGLHGIRLVEPLTIGFFEFFPRNLGRLKQLTWSHLWFLGYLFLSSVILLPLLLMLVRRAQNMVAPSAAVVYAPALLMAAVLAVFNGYWPFLPNLIGDWTNFAYFALCFAIGAGMAAWPGFETRLQAEAPRMLLLMLVAFTGLIVCGESTAGRAFVALTAWGAIGAGLGYAARLKPAATPMLAYLSEATLAVYILHHVPLLLLGAALLPLAIPVWIKIVAISVLTSLITLAAYHWLVRPWPPIRLLMGMSSGRAVAPSPARQAPGRS
jgi:hypothetical protein